MSNTLTDEVRALRDEVNAMRLDPDALLDELEIARAEGESPASAIRRVLDEARAGTEEARALLAEIREDVAALRGGGRAGQPGRVQDLAGIAEALGLPRLKAGDLDPGGMRRRVLDAIGVLRESASREGDDNANQTARAGVEEALRDRLDRLVRDLGTVPSDDLIALYDQVVAALKDPDRAVAADDANAFTARQDLEGVASELGVHERTEDLGRECRRVVRDMQRALREAGAQPAKPARGAGPRLDAVLTALNMPPEAWRSTKPADLAAAASARVWGPAEMAELHGLRDDLDVPRDLPWLNALHRTRAIVAAGLGIARPDALNLQPEDAIATSRLWPRPLTMTESLELEGIRDELDVPGDLSRLAALRAVRAGVNVLRKRAGSGNEEYTAQTEVKAWTRAAFNMAVMTLQPVNFTAYGDGETAEAPDVLRDLMTMLSDVREWGESARFALLRLWPDAVEACPLKYEEPKRTLAQRSIYTPETLRKALGELATNRREGLVGLDAVLASGESLSDVLERLLEDWDEKAVKDDKKRSKDETDDDLHEAVARATYETVHGAGEWTTTDYVLREDLIRAVREAVPSK